MSLSINVDPDYHSSYQPLAASQSNKVEGHISAVSREALGQCTHCGSSLKQSGKVIRDLNPRNYGDGIVRESIWKCELDRAAAVIGCSMFTIIFGIVGLVVLIEKYK